MLCPLYDLLQERITTRHKLLQKPVPVAPCVRVAMFLDPERG